MESQQRLESISGSTGMPRGAAVLDASEPPSGAGTAEPPTLQQGSNGPAVREWQRQLAALSFWPGKPDGDFGRKTDRATRAFQAYRGLLVDGIVGPRTRAAAADMLARLEGTGAPGADSYNQVTHTLSGKTLIHLAMELHGKPPAFWARYFSRPATPPRPGDYSPAKEGQALHDAGIRLLPIARQTRNVDGTAERGRADGQENARVFIERLGRDHLMSQGGKLYMFLDIEAVDPCPSLSSDYFIGWAQGLADVAAPLELLPCIYMRQGDTTTAKALCAANERGVTCRALWIAHWFTEPQFSVPPWNQERVQIALDFPCKIIAWQYRNNYPSDVSPVLDCNQVNPIFDLEADLLRYLALPPGR